MATPADTLTFGEAVSNAFPEYWNEFTTSFSHPDVRYPLIYLLVVYVAMFILEHAAPKRLNYPVVGRKGFWTDLLYLFFIDYAIEVIGLYAIAVAVEYITLHTLAYFGIHTPLFDLHEALPPWARFFVFFIVIDFLQWLAHFLLHRINFFWQFHKIHHAQEQLGFGSTRHFHFGEYLLLKPAFWIPFALLGFRLEMYVLWYVWVAYLLTFLSHCNVKISWGPLKYIFITPETHYWHHARNIPGRFGVNYASSLVIWDLLFGHWYNPKDKEPILGIPENDVPDSFSGQIAYPFKAIFRMKSSPAQNKDKDFVPSKSRQEKRKSKRT